MTSGSVAAEVGAAVLAEVAGSTVALAGNPVELPGDATMGGIEIAAVCSLAVRSFCTPALTAAQRFCKLPSFSAAI